MDITSLAFGNKFLYLSVVLDIGLEKLWTDRSLKR
jgi:hypothetical protein